MLFLSKTITYSGKIEKFRVSRLMKYRYLVNYVFLTCVFISIPLKYCFELFGMVEKNWPKYQEFSTVNLSFSTPDCDRTVFVTNL